MRVSELSRASGASIPTIKYYLREGLLPPGRPLARNQADYDDAHVRRLHLIRVLMDVGGLGVAAVRDVLQAVDDADLPMHDLLGVAHCALGPAGDSEPVADDVAEARREVDTFLADLGWRCTAKSPSKQALADALVALRRLGFECKTDAFRPYAKVADSLAAKELKTIPTDSRVEAVERVVVGTVVFESALVALRRLAQAHRSAERFAAAPRVRAQPRAGAQRRSGARTPVR